MYDINSSYIYVKHFLLIFKTVNGLIKLEENKVEIEY